jgi:hypothetical protein
MLPAGGSTQVGAGGQRMAAARDQQVRFVRQRFEIEFVGGGRVEDAADHQIELAATQALDQHFTGRHLDRDVHPRMARLEQVDRLRHQAGGRRQHGADAHASAQTGQQFHHLLVGRVHLGQRRAGAPDKYFPVPGRRDAAREPFEQLNAKRVFKLAQ